MYHIGLEVLHVIGFLSRKERFDIKPQFSTLLVWEADIYSRTAGKNGRPALERLRGDTVDISAWLEFEFYDLVWFWNNQSDDTNPMLGRWIGVSHRFISDICYWIISEKGKDLY